MTRAAEFCYIAETKDGAMLMSMNLTDVTLPWWWTSDPEMALRMTNKWCQAIASLELRDPVGFRKVLVG